MVRPLLAAVLGGLTACGPAAPVPQGPEAEAQAAVAARRGGVIDQADVLSPLEEQAIASRIAALSATRARKVTVVTIVPPGGDSLERVGWAVGGGRGDAATILLLVDPQARQVRVEGALPPEQRALVAGAMAADLTAGRYGGAVGKGLERLAGLPA